MYYTPGSYQVSLTVWNDYGENMKVKTGYININPTAAEIFNEAGISFYPNPASDLIFVNCKEHFEFSLFDLNGRLLLNGINNNRVDISGIGQGMYLIEINSGEKVLRERFVKN